MPSPSTSSATSYVARSSSSSIRALVEGTKWGSLTGNGATLSYSFPWTTSASATYLGENGASTYSSLNEQNASLHYGLNAAQQTAARSALQAWADVANLIFSEEAESNANVGDIRFGWTSASSLDSTSQPLWGWAYPPSFQPSSGDIWISTAAGDATTNTQWTAASHNYSALIHELGHALGLKHPFDGNLVLPAAQNTTQYTVMSNTQHPHGMFGRLTHLANNSVSWAAYNIEPETPMLYDVAAIQHLYGANRLYKTGNDIYTFDPATPFIKTIWDAGGTDTISVANFTDACIIDLRPGRFSKITINSDSSAGYNWPSQPIQPTYDGTDNLAIAFDCIIENAIGGGGGDTLIGNDDDNSLTGAGGNDVISGGAGVDNAIYSGNLARYTITKTSTGHTVKDNEGNEENDSLDSIERLFFSDSKLALDLTGNAAAIVKILGVVGGATSLSNTAYVGIGLTMLDDGINYADLMLIALNAKLGAGFSNTDEVNLLYQNLVGAPPSPAELDYWTATLSSGQLSQTSLAIMAADLDLNSSNINLLGLQQTGIAYSL